jgi:hypothetical protein
VGREPGRVLERDLAAQGPRTFLHAGGNGRVLEHERAAQRPRTFVQLAGRMQNKPHSRRLRACYLQLTQAGQRTKPDSTRRLPRGRPLLKRCHIFCSAWNNTTASAVSFLSQLHHGNKSRPIVLVQAFGAMQKQLVKTHLSKKLFNQQHLSKTLFNQQAMQKQLVKTHLSKKLFNQQASLN